MSDILRLVRPAIAALPPADIAGPPPSGCVRLNANENPYGALVQGQGSLNRYPDPQPEALRRRMADLYGVSADRLWVTRGSDDAIDLLIRAFCEAGRDSIGIVEPTFSAYAQFARVQGAGIVAARLGEDFHFDPAAALSVFRDARPKLLFLCTPNNPTGTVISQEAVRQLRDGLENTVIVVDEAYGEFAEEPSLASEAGNRLVVLRTLSKAYGLAGARIGCLMGSPELIELVARASPPYPLPAASIAAALEALGSERMPVHRQRIASLVEARAGLAARLADVPEIRSVRQGGNFLFLEVTDPEGLARRLSMAAIQVRFRPNAAPGGVRVTIGTPEENAALLAVFGLESEKPSRRIEWVRDTKETRIALSIDLDRADGRRIDTGVGFFDHMLDQVAAHGGFGLTLSCDGDTQIDAHHSVEDVSIALGQALKIALGDKRGIGRFGFALPMDETQASVLIDLSGRPYCRFEGEFTSDSVGGLPTEMVPHVFRSLADSMAAAIHVRVDGENDHHKVEACFKAFGRALRQAMAIETREAAIPSTKGQL